LREDDVRGTYNHDDSKLLGRTKSGTLRLSVDKRGLRYEIDPPDAEHARALMESLRRGDVDGSSFMFKPDVTSYRQEGDQYIMCRESVYLFDVGPVTFPAYDSTDAGLRSAADAEAVRREIEEWKRSRAPKLDTRGEVAARSRAVFVMMNS
jgi:HK97 family phage prohead protease